MTLCGRNLTRMQIAFGKSCSSTYSCGITQVNQPHYFCSMYTDVCRSVIFFIYMYTINQTNNRAVTRCMYLPNANVHWTVAFIKTKINTQERQRHHKEEEKGKVPACQKRQPVYMCNICNCECKQLSAERPWKDNLIFCDRCHKWCHFVCVNIFNIDDDDQLGEDRWFCQSGKDMTAS